MTHHLLPEMERDWLAGLTNCFLIRDPAEVIASYMKKNENPELEDLGFVRQAEIFEWVRKRLGKTPPVIDARDVLQNPERYHAATLWGRRDRIRSGHAFLAARAARDGWGLGEALVWRSSEIDRIRALSRAINGCPGTIARHRSALPRVLRAALRISAALTLT